jgi:hypothetical protein
MEYLHATNSEAAELAAPATEKRPEGSTRGICCKEGIMSAAEKKQENTKPQL